MTLRHPAVISIFVVLILVTANLVAHFRADGRREIQLSCKEAGESFSRNFFVPVEEKEARALYSYDFSAGKVLYQKNADMALPLASLTKLMTIQVSLPGRVLSELYTIKKEDLAPSGSIGLVAGERFTIRDLARAAMIASSNDAALALARSTGLSDGQFIAKMNSTANVLGLSSMRFESPTGLDTRDSGGQATVTGNARDTLTLLYKDYIDFPYLFDEVSVKTASVESIGGTMHELKNTNSAAEDLPLLVAAKTGYTEVAGGNLATLWRTPEGHIVGAIALGSTEEGRFSDTKAVYHSANAFIEAMNDLSKICTTS